MSWSPAVGIIGPRQVGKSTLAEAIVSQYKDAVYIDLESPDSRLQLSDPLYFFQTHEDRLICLDEIQSIPDIFVPIKSHIDRRKTAGAFLLLGSASPALLKQTAESLAGRLIYKKLLPFSVMELPETEASTLIMRGGFPRSILAPDDPFSMTWRKSFIQTFLERDLLQLKQGISPAKMRALWTMVAHMHGQLLNYSSLSRSLDVSNTTITNYLDILEGAFVINRIQPYHINIKKRLVKSSKVYVGDSGILHALLGISDFDQLNNHPVKGASMEGHALQNIKSVLPDYKIYFYRTAKGAELDFVLEKGGKITGVEVKSSTHPHLNKGFWNALEDLNPVATWIIAPVEKAYSIRKDIHVANLRTFLKAILDQK